KAFRDFGGWGKRRIADNDMPVAAQTVASGRSDRALKERNRLAGVSQKLGTRLGHRERFWRPLKDGYAQVLLGVLNTFRNGRLGDVEEIRSCPKSSSIRNSKCVPKVLDT
ncbi:MAG: hypothetical protein VYA18_06310, partial [Pseudomonadota bacterium]|nr:hypothetical protein [Pseudomonadota bacterium]